MLCSQCLSQVYKCVSGDYSKQSDGQDNLILSHTSLVVVFLRAQTGRNGPQRSSIGGAIAEEPEGGGQPEV